MKKYILTIFSVGAAFMNAQQYSGLFVESEALGFVQPSALMFIDGGIKNKGAVKNAGNVIQSGSNGDVFATLKADGSAATQADAQSAGVGSFLNVLNQETNYPLFNTIKEGDSYTYGQLIIKGIPQENITGFATQQYRNVNHGAYQQVALPFYEKKLSSLSTELGKTFSTSRWSGNAVLKFDNANAVFDHFTDLEQTIVDPSGYYILGNSGNSIDLQSTTRNITGHPFSDVSGTTVNLWDAAKNVDFGTGGTAWNKYKEKYSSYIQDGFELQAALGGLPWQGNYGKNIYQLGNPFLANLDARAIFTSNPNIYGIRVEQAANTVAYVQNEGGGATGFRFVTWNEAAAAPVGDVDWLIIRPLSVFVIKMKDNNTQRLLKLNDLRTFSYKSGENVETYGRAAKNVSSVASVKQLAVIGLDGSGKEIGRTYYVVSGDAQTGHNALSRMQVTANTNNALGSFEEKANGGYDPEYSSRYWLYINEANENSFKGKPIPAVIYNKDVKSLKFEIRENAEVLKKDQNLTSGENFYYSIKDGDALKITGSENPQINITDKNLGINLYYGAPEKTLATNEANEVKVSRTKIVYSDEAKKWVVLFDPTWKLAEKISVFDMSGKLIKDWNKINTSSSFNIDLDVKMLQVYVVRVISDQGEVVTSKIKY